MEFLQATSKNYNLRLKLPLKTEVFRDSLQNKRKKIIKYCIRLPIINQGDPGFCRVLFMEKSRGEKGADCMIRGWYIGASGMTAQQNRLDAIANNLANVDTTGFKKEIPVSKTFSELLLRRANADGVYQVSTGSCDAAPIIGSIGLGVETNELFTDFDQGSFKSTETSTDLALGGKGFFAVETPDGERYTRNGNFLLGKEGILLTKEGYPVLGENGHITVADDKFFVNDDGMVINRETNEISDRIKLVRFDSERDLKKQGSSLWYETVQSGPAHIAEGKERPKVLQGYTETSNVNVVNEMVQMIEVNRAYEANQKAIQTEDDMMDTLWNKVVAVNL